MTGPLKIVSIFCRTCGGNGWISEREYEQGKTPHQAISIKVICPECNGSGKTQAHKFVRSSEKHGLKMNNTVIRKVTALQGTVKALADEYGLEPNDLVVLTVSIEKVIGDPVSFLLSKIQSSDVTQEET